MKNGKEEKTNKIFKNWGIFVNTCRGEQYEINKVIIFKDNQEKMIANYFLDNFKNNEFDFLGDTQRKLKKDLTSDNNFIIKSEEQNSWNEKTQYTLYINGDLNNYSFIGLNLCGTQLQALYYINAIKCDQCIGWNQKESNNAKYHEFEPIYKECNYFNIDSTNYEKNLKKLVSLYKKYKKALEIEKSYTANDYKKMQLSSGTTQEENLTILKNNGFDISGIKKED